MPTTPDRNRPPEPVQTVETMPASQARREWAQLLNRVQRDGAPVLIEKNGVPVAALISPRKLDFLLAEMEKREEAFQAIEALQDAFQAAFADVPDDELERQIEKAVAEARAELRAEALARAQAVDTARAS
jgi:prevent-host-death family protein